jgi:hypothetical protein
MQEFWLERCSDYLMPHLIILAARWFRVCVGYVKAIYMILDSVGDLKGC